MWLTLHDISLNAPTSPDHLLVATCNLLEGCFQLRDFVFHNKPQLSIAHAVTVNDYSLGQITVYFTVFLQCGCGKIQGMEVVTLVYETAMCL